MLWEVQFISMRYSDRRRVKPKLNINDAISELKLKVDPSDGADLAELQTILTSYLFYPSDELAQLHRESNRLGEYDRQEARSKLQHEFEELVTP